MRQPNGGGGQHSPAHGTGLGGANQHFSNSGGITPAPPWWADGGWAGIAGANWPGGTGGGKGKPGGMTANQQSAFDQLNAFLDSYGLSSLSGFVKNLILDGVTDAASIQLQLQQTNEWKQRFAGNEMLKANGYGVLSPAEYLSLERSYGQIMKNFGLPEGFYDDPADFAKWIGNNVSAAELQQRVSAYSDIANREDPETVKQLNSMGMSTGDLLAYMMDPGRAAPLIQRKYQTVVLGSAARRAGMVADNGYLDQLASRGVSEQQASQGFGLVASTLKDAQNLSGVYGDKLTAQDLQSEVFDNSASAAKKRKTLASKERASFSGSAGVGSLTQDSSGSY